MIRVKLFVQGDRHPIQAWRMNDISEVWKVAQGVVDRIRQAIMLDATADPINPKNFRVVTDEVVKGTETEKDITAEYLENPEVWVVNGPLLWEIKESIESILYEQDAVQARINKGQSI